MSESLKDKEKEWEQRKDAWKEDIKENIDKGEQVYSVFKGEGLQRLTGKMTDTESFSLGHFDGHTNVTLNVVKTTEEGLNTLFKGKVVI